jgi:hypothetical protein
MLEPYSTSHHQSEVARLLAAIEAEHEASRSGLSGLAEGTARHDFITKRQENIWQHFQALVVVVNSPQEAMALIATSLEHPTGEGSQPL